MDEKKKGKLSFSERVLIEIGLYKGQSLKNIAIEMERHPTSISREIRANRIETPARSYKGNECYKAPACKKTGVCKMSECDLECSKCTQKKCRDCCKAYESMECAKLDLPPYVCNGCKKVKTCQKHRYFYSAKKADGLSNERRSESRKGIQISDAQLSEMDLLISELVKKGQPLSHIYSEHGNEMPVSIRTVYNYIDSGELSISNMDLRRKVRYKKRKQQKNHDQLDKQHCRQDRTYDDYQKYMEGRDENIVVEMDTVQGKREKGQRLLTMIFRKNSVMLMFLIPDGTAESVTRVFDYLDNMLGTEVFRRLFQVILTDNGGEFKHVIEMETTENMESRTMVFYCDPMASWQKPHIEKNHEFIRYVIPKGKSMGFLTHKKVIKLMNHINSIKRPTLGGKSPYELMMEDADMMLLAKLLNLEMVCADEVHLLPDLLDD